MLTADMSVGALREFRQFTCISVNPPGDLTT